jgi:hypothetical protein
MGTRYTSSVRRHIDAIRCNASRVRRYVPDIRLHPFTVWRCRSSIRRACSYALRLCPSLERLCVTVDEQRKRDVRTAEAHPSGGTQKETASQ